MKQDKLEYNFAEKFTKTPGPRYRRLGEFSGEEFREILEKLLKEYEIIEIDGSGITTSFSPSFLSEAFGKLAETMGNDELFRRIKLFSNSNPNLEEKFRNYAKV